MKNLNQTKKTTTEITIKEQDALKLSQTSSYEALLKVYSPKQAIVSLKSIRSISDSLSNKTPTILSMTLSCGEEKAEKFIQIWLVALNEALNLKRLLNETQIIECSYFIIEKYKHIMIGDINIIFNKAKSGEYGEFYESLSIAKIMSWFDEYFIERCQFAAAKSRRDADRHKKKFNDQVTDTRVTNSNSISDQFNRYSDQIGNLKNKGE